MQMKLLSTAVAVLVGFGAGYVVFAAGSARVVQNHTPHPVNTSGSITCTYPQILHAFFQDGQIEQSIPAPETSPMIFTFSDLGEELARLQYVDATRTISEVVALVVHDDKDKIVLIEGGGESYMTTHTIFKNSGIGMYSKQILLPFADVPSGSMAMGSCV